MLLGACSAGDDPSNKQRSLINGLGQVLPQQHSWFEEDEEEESEENDPASEKEAIPPTDSLAVVPDAKPNETDAEANLGEVVGNIAADLASKPDDDAPNQETPAEEENPPTTIAEDDEEIPTYTADLLGECKKALGLGADANLPVISVTPGAFAKGQFTVTQDLAFVVFNAEKSITKLNIKLDSPKGRYCLDMRAEKLLKKVSVESACGANTVFLKLKAHRSIKNEFRSCDSAGSVKTVEVDAEMTGPTQQEVADLCKNALSLSAEKMQVKTYNLDFGVSQGDRLDVSERFAIVNIMNSKKLTNFKLNLDHPDGRYCVNIQAEKKVKGLTILTRCPNAEKQTAPQIIGLTLGAKKLKKVNVDTCTPESMQQVEKKVADAKKAIKDTKEKIKEIKKDKTLTKKEKKAKIAAEKQQLKESQKAKKQAKKDLKKLKKK